MFIKLPPNVVYTFENTPVHPQHQELVFNGHAQRFTMYIGEIAHPDKHSPLLDSDGGKDLAAANAVKA